MAKLIVTGPDKAPVHFFLESDRVCLGRGETCALKLEGTDVSKEHAAILAIGNDHILEDLQSTNGTLVNDVRVSRHVLQNRDVVLIGTYRIQYINQRALKNMDFDHTMLFDGDRMETNPDATLVDTSRTRGLLASKAWLEDVAGGMEGQRHKLDQLIHRFDNGRGSAFAILRRPQGFSLMHVTGPERLKVNGRPLSEDWHDLVQGDEIVLGKESFRFHAA
jgi:predicted component of type VI protein secretion system